MKAIKKEEILKKIDEKKGRHSKVYHKLLNAVEKGGEVKIYIYDADKKEFVISGIENIEKIKNETEVYFEIGDVGLPRFHMFMNKRDRYRDSEIYALIIDYLIQNNRYFRQIMFKIRALALIFEENRKIERRKKEILERFWYCYEYYRHNEFDFWEDTFQELEEEVNEIIKELGEYERLNCYFLPNINEEEIVYLIYELDPKGISFEIDVAFEEDAAYLKVSFFYEE